MQACQGKPDAAGTGSESILLVEDDAGIRRLVERVLHKAGYRVTIASNGREALELGGRERFDLLVTDIVMPYVNGVQLATELGETNRDLRVLYMSGYAGQHLRARGLKADERFLAKPFTPAELLRNVRSALEGRARPSLSSSRSQIAR